jgi:flagellar basal-body rod modification protein FlgD
VDIQPTNNQVLLERLKKGGTVQVPPDQLPSGELTGSSSRQTVTQDEFLKLLTTQLQYQDPLKPMDNQEFTAQLATFNSLDQLININNSLKSLQSAQLTASQLQATSLIGKEVSLQGNQLSLGTDGEAEAGYNLAADAARVTVIIKDLQGNVVRSLEQGPQKAGERDVTWDGKTADGKTAPPGQYTIEVNAFDTAGKTVSSTSLVKGIVSGVDLSGNEVMLTVGKLQIPVSALLSVRTPVGT